jgi:hypothetical protein
MLRVMWRRHRQCMLGAQRNHRDKTGESLQLEFRFENASNALVKTASS